MFEVLEPRWHELEHKLESVGTVDELMKHHTDFLDTCLRECLLTHQGLIKTLAKLMTTCLLFAQQIGRFAEQLHIDEDSMKRAALQVSFYLFFLDHFFFFFMRIGATPAYSTLTD